MEILMEILLIIIIIAIIICVKKNKSNATNNAEQSSIQQLNHWKNRKESSYYKPQEATVDIVSLGNKKGLSFTVLDLETADWHLAASIVQIGITVVENGEIKETKKWLIKPYLNHISQGAYYIHHISEKKTENAPEFIEVFEEIKPYLENKLVVCHNADFDIPRLLGTCKYYNLECPYMTIFCTLMADRKLYPLEPSHKLKDVYKRFTQNDFKNSHDAGNDTIATATVFLNQCKDLNIEHISSISNRMCIKLGCAQNNMYAKPIEYPIYQQKIDAFNRFTKKTADNQTHLFQNEIVCVEPNDYASQKQWKEFILNQGGEYKSAMSKSVTLYLTDNNENNSYKEKKYKEFISKGLNIKKIILSEFISSYLEEIW